MYNAILVVVVIILLCLLFNSVAELWRVLTNKNEPHPPAPKHANPRTFSERADAMINEKGG